ncbi:MAG: YHYH protein, partial [Saprospiraceae bacterium]|nr:YHYH protein [Saprospiraceae bacterium]
FIEGLGDLDKANGRYGVTPEFPSGTYYYLITDEFPFVPRYFKGTPSNDFRIQ